jgi:2-amino-4-hydroxy-6-hydroxymethyldihydropteridine diphosphokinase
MSATKENSAILSLGSNISPETNIELAIDKLQQLGSVQKCSDILETKPIGIKEQANFLNCAVLLRTSFQQELLNKGLKQIEDDLLRDRTAPKFGPRTIDIDIVVWNGAVIDPDYHDRDFLKKCVDQLLGD